MVSRRTLLIFNFGIGAALLVMALLGSITITTLAPNVGRVVALPTLDVKVAQELRESEDLQHVREKALFYFRLAKDLKESRSAEELAVLEAMKYVCYVLAAAFATAGLMVVAMRSGGTGSTP